MTPSAVMEDSVATLIGADTTKLAEATPFVQVILLKAAFTESRNLVLADLVEADFDGYAGLHADSAATQVFNDPGTATKEIQLREPAGGWHWVTSGVTHLNQTIYGYAVTNAAKTVLLGTHAENLGTLSAIGQGIDIPQVRFKLPTGFLQ